MTLVLAEAAVNIKNVVENNVIDLKLRRLLLCILSSGLLVLAFPKTDLWFLAWVGLVPLMLAVEGQRSVAAFKWAYLCGVIFFSGTLYWFVHVTFIGAALLILYLAIYFGLFGVLCSVFSSKKITIKLLLLPAGWIVLEWLRAHLFSGFGWVSLGHSQYKTLPIIQIADVTGVYGISFIIVAVNYVIKEILVTKERSKVWPALGWVVGMLGIVLFYGQMRLQKSFDNQESLKIAVIQANIPQEMKWQQSAWGEIMRRYKDLTSQAAARNPDLIIWPETAFPEFLGKNDVLFKELKEFIKKQNIPLLFGAVSYEGEKYYNSAMLLSDEGAPLEKYHKLHLVPFGEYLPFRFLFPFLSDIIPIADFTVGKEYHVFSSGKQQKQFSVLICFEDTISQLAREFVNQGAGILINITNDAWFKNSPAPFMHLQAALFRSVENRRSLVRSANTGVSCFIDPAGRIKRYLRGEDQRLTFSSGYAIASVALNQGKTFYTRFGDIFVYLCFGGVVVHLMINGKRNKEKICQIIKH